MMKFFTGVNHRNPKILYNKIKQYVGLYVLSLPISLVMIERIYILCLFIIIKSEVWTITHCLGLGHETMVSAVCLSIFLCTHILYGKYCRYVLDIFLGGEEHWTTEYRAYYYRGFRCSGNTMRHGISKHGIDLIILEYYTFSTRTVKPSSTKTSTLLTIFETTLHDRHKIITSIHNWVYNAEIVAVGFDLDHSIA